MTRWPDRDAEEGKRSIALSLSNAVFSKLIKMGRDLGKTPQRMAQELFEDAYARQGSGKAKLAAQVSIAGEPAEAKAFEDFRQLSLIAEDWKAKHAKAEEERAQLWRKCRELEGDRDVAKAAAAEAMDQVEHMVSVVAGNARQLLDQADTIRRVTGERDELSLKCWNAEAERDRLREAAKGQLVIVNQASEILQGAELSPAAQLRAIKAMRAASNSPAAIARALGVSIETVRAALA